MLHDQLNIDLIDGAGTDVDLILIFRQHKAGLDTLDIQQLIGRLRADDCRALQIVPLTD